MPFRSRLFVVFFLESFLLHSNYRANLLIASRKSKGPSGAWYDTFWHSASRHFVLVQFLPSVIEQSRNERQKLTFALDRIRLAQFSKLINLTVTASQMP